MGLLRESVMSIHCENWNNVKIPNLNYVFFNSEVNFLAVAKSDEEEMRFFCTVQTYFK